MEMSNKKQQIPAVRFNGFTDAWEQRKLEKIFRKIRNAFVGTATPYYVENGHFYLESNNVKDGKINRNSEIFINDEFYEKQRDKWLHTNDLVMVQSGHVGHTAVIPEELDASAAHALIMFQDYKVKSNPYFLNYQFQTSDSRKKLDIITTGNTIKHILASEMKKFEVSLPIFEEQTKIGTFFKHLDDTIALHQRQLDNYREWKKAMVQKMFPHDGEKIPEVRFEGFTGEWEERKVNDIFHEIFSGNRLPKTSLVEGEVPYIIAKVTNNGEFMKIDNNSLDYHGNKMKLFPSPSITFSIDNPEAIFVQKYPFFTSNIMRVLHNPSLSYNQNIFFYLWIKSLTTYFNWSIKFSGPVVMNSIIYIPINQKGDAINFDEIERVGGFFKQLDDTITLHQQKVNDYQQLKNTMLQQMFV